MATDLLILKALSWLVDDACKRKLALMEEDERLRGELKEAVDWEAKWQRQKLEHPGVLDVQEVYGRGDR